MSPGEFVVIAGGLAMVIGYFLPDLPVSLAEDGPWPKNFIHMRHKEKVEAKCYHSCASTMDTVRAPALGSGMGAAPQ